MLLQRRKRGFTLIELMLVMFILVILAGIAVPLYYGYLKTAKVRAAKAQIGLFETAINSYESSVGDFPTESQGLQALMTAPDGVDGWSGPYIKGVPNDPWGDPYVYKNPGANNPFDIISFGPDKQEGTADDISNNMPTK